MIFPGEYPMKTLKHVVIALVRSYVYGIFYSLPVFIGILLLYEGVRAFAEGTSLPVCLDIRYCVWIGYAAVFIVQTVRTIKKLQQNETPL
jgi:hypothetical protein